MMICDHKWSDCTDRLWAGLAVCIAARAVLTTQRIS